MPKRYQMSFGPGNEEYFITYKNTLHTAPLGSFLLDFLSADLTVYQTQLSAHSPRDMLLPLIPAFCKAISSIHPIFACLMLSFDPSSDDALGWFKEKIGTMIHFQEQFLDRTKQVLFADGESLTSLQKYYLLLGNDPLANKAYYEKNQALSLERKIFDCQTEFIPVNANSVMMIPQSLSTMVFYASDDLETIIHAYFEHLVEANFPVQQCAYCGRYFRPFSRRSIYCDRPVGTTGKTCKDLAAQEKHNKKVAADEGLSLFRKNNKAYAMRVHRAPSIYKDKDYQRWKTIAENALKKYVDGEISLDTLKLFLELPKTKKH